MKNKVDLSFLEEDLADAKTMDDLMGQNGVIKKLLKTMTEKILAEEMESHLGYEKNSPVSKNTANRRNGKNKKTVRTGFGDMELETPRDRNSDFEPQLVKKELEILQK